MLIILPLIAILTSLISGAVGMAGGVLLLSAMSFFMDYRLLIPIHGIIQLVSNSSRAFYLKGKLRKEIILPYLIGAPIGGLISYFILNQIQKPTFFYGLLGLFILYTVFKPKKFPEIRLNKFGWFILGIGASIQSALLGASGPLVAIFYMRSDISKEEIVANKALQQFISHFLKIPLFIGLSFDYVGNGLLISLMSFGAVAGTYLGVNVLKKMDDSRFKIIFKIFLLIAATRLFYKFAINL